MCAKLNNIMMEKSSGPMLPYIFKRIIYFHSDRQAIVTETVRTINNEIFASNSCDPYECIVGEDSIGIHCNNESLIKRLERCIIKKLPDNTIVYPHYTENRIRFEDIRTFQKHKHLRLGQLISEAVQVLKESIDKFTFNKIFLSFNGGKDCVVVLHLYRAVLEELKYNGLIKVVYFQSDDQFSEEEDFVQSTVRKFNLDLTIIKGELKSGLNDFLKKNPQFSASIIGTRQSDLGSTKLQFFQNTDSGWPPLVRIQPLIHWDYDSVWSFLRQFSIPYCCLYDKGYSSLGSKSKSHPNTNLKYEDENTGEVKYWPAFLLQNGNSERENRL